MVSTRLLLCLALFVCCAATEEVETVERQVEHVDMLPRLHLVRDFASDAEMDYIIKVWPRYQRASLGTFFLELHTSNS